MSAQNNTQAMPLFYQQVEVLNKSAHEHLALSREPDYSFAANTNAIPSTVGEFAKLAPEYPIVFVANDNSVSAVSIVGLEQDKNWFVDGTSWRGNYVPAYIRRYPFVLAGPLDGGDQPVCIDTGSKLWVDDGEALFADGEHTALLQRAMEFLKDHQADNHKSVQLIERLVSLNLLEEVQAHASFSTGEKIHLGGMKVVNRSRLNALSDEMLASLVRDGVMDAIVLHLISLKNFAALMNDQKSL